MARKRITLISKETRIEKLHKCLWDAFNSGLTEEEITEAFQRQLHLHKTRPF